MLLEIIKAHRAVYLIMRYISVNLLLYYYIILQIHM